MYNLSFPSSENSLTNITIMKTIVVYIQL